MNQFTLYLVIAISAATTVAAFTPMSNQKLFKTTTTTELSATIDRRDAFNLLFGGVIAASSLIPDTANAVNPALETFKGGKKTKGSFIPGKGLREHESFETLVAANPALETFKGSKSTKGSFIPGKGIRNHDDDNLIAANPALETFKGRKRTPGSFVPGKGIRHHDDDNLIAANPALETFKGRKRTPGSFVPGKGIRHQEVVYEEFLMSKNIHNTFDTLIAANPALETFKGRKRTPGSFMPGKGYVFMFNLIHTAIIGQLSVDTLKCNI